MKTTINAVRGTIVLLLSLGTSSGAWASTNASPTASVVPKVPVKGDVVSVLGLLESAYGDAEREIEEQEQVRRDETAKGLFFYRREKGEYSGKIRLFPLYTYEYDDRDSSRDVTVWPILTTFFFSGNEESAISGRGAILWPLLTGGVRMRNETMTSDLKSFSGADGKGWLYGSLPLFTFWVHDIVANEGRTLGSGFVSLPLLTSSMTIVDTSETPFEYSVFYSLPLLLTERVTSRSHDTNGVPASLHTLRVGCLFDMPLLGAWERNNLVTPALQLHSGSLASNLHVGAVHTHCSLLGRMFEMNTEDDRTTCLSVSPLWYWRRGSNDMDRAFTVSPLLTRFTHSADGWDVGFDPFKLWPLLWSNDTGTYEVLWPLYEQETVGSNTFSSILRPFYSYKRSHKPEEREFNLLGGLLFGGTWAESQTLHRTLLGLVYSRRECKAFDGFTVSAAAGFPIDVHLSCGDEGETEINDSVLWGLLYSGRRTEEKGTMRLVCGMLYSQKWNDTEAEFRNSSLWGLLYSHRSAETSVCTRILTGLLYSQKTDSVKQQSRHSVLWGLLYNDRQDRAEDTVKRNFTPLLGYERKGKDKALRLLHFIRIPLSRSGGE